MSIGKVIKSGMWLFVGSALFNVLGYLYWIIISFFIPPAIMGSAATVLALYSPIVAALSFGLPIGVRRSLGSSWADNDLKSLTASFNFVLLFLAIVNIPIGLGLIGASLFFGGIPGIPVLESLFVGLFLLIEFWPPMFYSLYNSILRTKTVAIADIALSLIKLLTTVLLLYFGFGLLGILLGIFVGFLFRSILFSFETRKLWSSWSIKSQFKFLGDEFKPLMKSGIAYWIPHSLSLVGQSAGILALYFYVGPTETGLYQVSLVMAIIIYRLPDSIQTVMFPYLSGLRDGKQEAASSGIKLSSAMTIPLVFLVLSYPTLPFMFLDITYSPASILLGLLVVGAIVHPMVSGYTSYIYSEGAYSDVALVGVSMALTRVTLVLLLTPMYGGQGAAIAYSTGVFLSLLVCQISARRTGFHFEWLDWVKAIVPPLFVYMVLTYFSVHWIIGVPSILALSFLTYARLRLITRNDLREIAREIMSEDAYARLSARVRPIISRLFSN